MPVPDDAFDVGLYRAPTLQRRPAGAPGRRIRRRLLLRLRPSRPRSRTARSWASGRRTSAQLTPEEEQKTQAASTRIVAKDPITLSGNAYVTAIGQIATGNIKHAMDLYQAENGRYPANYDEFMTEIIKKNNIALPVLPSYQEYFYDEQEHKLQVREYPDRKARAHPGGN